MKHNKIKILWYIIIEILTTVVIEYNHIFIKDIIRYFINLVTALIFLDIAPRKAIKNFDNLNWKLLEKIYMYNANRI